ncbi:MAG: hypothetical protein ACQEUZ_01605 [Pseudomonadota bacterium]
MLIIKHLLTKPGARCPNCGSHLERLRHRPPTPHRAPIVAAIAVLLYVFGLSSPIPAFPPPSAHGDLTLQMAGFATLAFILCDLTSSTVAVFLTGFLATRLKIAQAFAPERSADALDLLASIGGATAAGALVSWRRRYT